MISMVVTLQDLRIASHPGPNHPFVLLLQDKLLLKDIMAPAMHAIYSNIMPGTTAEDPATVPAANPACIPAKHAMHWVIKKQQLLLTGPPSPLLLEAPTGAARAEAVTTAVVVFIAKDLRTRTARAMAYPRPPLLTGPAPVLLLMGPAAVLFLEAPPAVLMLPAPPTASPPALATTAVVVFVAKDLSKRPQTTNAAAHLLLLMGPAPQLLLTPPPAQLLLQAPPAGLMLEAPPIAPPPTITTAVVVFIGKDLTKRDRALSAAVRPLRLTWLAPPPVLLLTWSPRRILLSAPPTAAPPTSIMTSVAVPAFVRKDLAPWTARLVTRPQLPAAPPIRPLEPHPRLLLQALPAAALPITIKTNFALRPSLREDGMKQPTSMTACRLPLTWPTPVQPVSAPGPALLMVRRRVSETLMRHQRCLSFGISQVLMQECHCTGCHQQSWPPKSTQHRLAAGGRISGKRLCLQAPPATLAKTVQSVSLPPAESLPFNTAQGRCAVSSDTPVRICFSLQL